MRELDDPNHRRWLLEGLIKKKTKKGELKMKIYEFNKNC